MILHIAYQLEKSSLERGQMLPMNLNSNPDRKLIIEKKSQKEVIIYYFDTSRIYCAS